MAVTYVAFDGELVSEEINAFLVAARARGVVFTVREGHRTMARQAYFWSRYIFRRPGWTVAARPSPFAPHIRTGRIDHAIDVGGAQALINYGNTVGVHWRRTVRNEEWHLEASARELATFAARMRIHSPTLRKGVVNRAATRELQHLLKDKWGMKGFVINGRYDLPTRQAVRRWQKKHGDLTSPGVVDDQLWARLRKGP